MSDPETLFAANLLRMRKQSGQTLAELAEACGLDRAVVSKLERKIRSPSLGRHMVPIADALGTTVVAMLSPPRTATAATEGADPMAALIDAYLARDQTAFLAAVSRALRLF